MMLEEMVNEMVRQKIHSDGYAEGYMEALDEVGQKLKNNTYGGTKHNVPRQPLAELIELEASELRPATKFLDESAESLITKVAEEFYEVYEAYIEYKRYGRTIHLAEELVDLQFASETMLAKIRSDAAERRAIRKFVIAKNYNRGYYGEDEQS